MEWIEIIKAIILGIVEGITEWLPISSTGHMILVDEFMRLRMTAEFKEMFFVVIQLGAILAVVVLYWRKLLGLKEGPGKDPDIRKNTLSMWLKIIIACIPAGIIGFLLNNIINDLFYNAWVVAAMLILYGILFIVIENRNKKRVPKINDLKKMDCKTALLIGVFQVLSLIPGTSRSGATILGAILLGTSRTVAAEFTFFLAIPVMLGASLVKLLDFGFAFTNFEALILIVGMIVAFIVSILAIKFLVGYIKKHDFKAFGWYRIVLGAIVLLFFLLQRGL